MNRLSITNLKYHLMKTHEKEVVTDNLKTKQIRKRNLKMGLVPIFIFSLLIFSTKVTFAHCDTMDGPVIKDAKIAIERNNVNYVLKWVRPENEAEVKDVFSHMMRVRELSPEAKDLAEKYFFETLVRIHRAGEGIPFAGVKPSGTPTDERVLAADKSIEIGNLSPLKDLVPEDKLPELAERFEKVLSLKNFDADNVVTGRKYIEAYVQFFKFAEEEEDGHNEVNAEAVSHSRHIH